MSTTTDKRDNNINNILSNNTSQFSSLPTSCNQRDQQNRKQNYSEPKIETTWTLLCLKISNFYNYPLEKHIIINISGQPLTPPHLPFIFPSWSGSVFKWMDPQPCHPPTHGPPLAHSHLSLWETTYQMVIK